MASVTKFTASSVSVNLRHIERKIATPSNHDIDPDKSVKNYSLLSHGNYSTFEYYKARLEQLQYFHRADVKTMCGWVITAPQSLPEAEHMRFFELTKEFLQDRYGSENGVAAVVHMDESGQPHMHYYFIPVTKGSNRVCCKEVITRTELQKFHPELQRYLQEHGCTAQIMSGVTKANGGNRTVEQLKLERTHDRWHTHDYECTHDKTIDWEV